MVRKKYGPSMSRMGEDEKDSDSVMDRKKNNLLCSFEKKGKMHISDTHISVKLERGTFTT